MEHVCWKNAQMVTGLADALTWKILSRRLHQGKRNREFSYEIW